jgi:hypothetical protein
MRDRLGSAGGWVKKAWQAKNKYIDDHFPKAPKIQTEDVGKWARDKYNQANEGLDKVGAYAQDKVGRAAGWMKDKARQAYNYDGLVGGALNEKVGQAVDWAKRGLAAKDRYLDEKFPNFRKHAVNLPDGIDYNAVGNWAKDKAGQAGSWMKDKAGQAGDWAVDKAGQVDAWGKDKAGQAAGWMKGKYDDLAGTAAGQTVGQAAGWAKDKYDQANEGLDKIGAYAQDKVGAAAGWVKDKAGQATGWVKDKYDETQANNQHIKDMYQDSVGAPYINDAASKAKDLAEKGVGGIANMIKESGPKNYKQWWLKKKDRRGAAGHAYAWGQDKIGQANNWLEKQTDKISPKIKEYANKAESYLPWHGK